MKLAAKILGVALALYIVAFLLCFDPLSSPVRNKEHGWLGPLIRGDTHSQDVGKVYTYQSDDLFYYRVFWPFCKAWIFLNGL